MKHKTRVNNKLHTTSNQTLHRTPEQQQHRTAYRRRVHPGTVARCNAVPPGPRRWHRCCSWWWQWWGCYYCGSVKPMGWWVEKYHRSHFHLHLHFQNHHPHRCLARPRYCRTVPSVAVAAGVEWFVVDQNHGCSNSDRSCWKEWVN